MEQANPVFPGGQRRSATPPQRFRDLVHSLLSQASQGIPRGDFLARACRALQEFSGCEALGIGLGSDLPLAWHSIRPGRVPVVEPSAFVQEPPAALPEELARLVLKRSYLAAGQFLTRAGSFWTNDTALPVPLRSETGQESARTTVVGGLMQSVALVPILEENSVQGLLYLGSRRRDFFTRDDVQFHEAAAETLGVALAHQEAQWALGERMKELTCLYGVSKTLQRPELPVDELLREIAVLLPPGWQYPEVTAARITLDGRTCSTPGFDAPKAVQGADIRVAGEVRGRIEVAYFEARPEMDEGPFLKGERHLIDAVAETLGVALGHRSAQWALGERVKELTCLYGIAKVASRQGLPIDAVLLEIAGLLPPAWHYPEVAEARIILDDRAHATPGFREEFRKQEAVLLVDGRDRGRIQVAYAADRPTADEGPFLREERNLINEVARQVGLIIETREIDEEKMLLQDQLRHADRLATIGQLAAAAAHELNEPLGSILGFAQLAKECPGLPPQGEQDVERIVTAALHAREVIRKLMTFARRVPTRKTQVNVNRLVRDGLYFLESRCAREGIRLLRDTEEGLPEIAADPAQVHQVLVNLVVNAIQAMPTGGVLTITTRTDGESVRLTVQDTGCGMTEEVQKQMFLPFFTTKEVGEGTGLGLSVVHGIVTSHGGKIHVLSQPGRGTRVEVDLPVVETVDAGGAS